MSADNLPEPAVIAAEIAEDLEAALAQFAEIAATPAFGIRRKVITGWVDRPLRRSKTLERGALLS